MTPSAVDVVQSCAWYPPYSLGGTEVYLEGLVEELAAIGVRSAVLTPRPPGAPECYVHGSALVETWPVNATPEPGETKRGAQHADFYAFQKLLSRHRNAIYHQHAWTRGCGAHHLRAARDLGMRTVLTVHVPGNICLRGTMLKFGETACDGVVDERRCGACWAHSRGAPRPLAGMIANLPLAVARCARASNSRFATALSARALAAARSGEIAEMIANSDRVVAVCRWLHAALAANGAREPKLVLSRQGVSGDFRNEARAISARRASSEGPLKLLFLGRWDPVKGVDVVVRAIRSLPSEIPVRLTIHAVAAPPDGRGYEARVRDLAGDDARIAIEAPAPRGDLAAILAGHDALVVPSLWLETGPLVVLEAQAAGLFILGSRRGGIAELVDEEDDGELVEPGDVAAWAAAITRLVQRRLRSVPPRATGPVRTMAEVASEMAHIYQS